MPIPTKIIDKAQFALGGERRAYQEIVFDSCWSKQDWLGSMLDSTSRGLEQACRVPLNKALCSVLRIALETFSDLPALRLSLPNRSSGNYNKTTGLCVGFASASRTRRCRRLLERLVTLQLSGVETVT